MTKEQTIQQRVDKIVARIQSGNLKWKASVAGSNKQEYVIPEQETKEAFVALLTDIITEIVEHETEE